jgi:hypothetical protein
MDQPRRKFNKILLDECLLRDGATLIGEYESLTKRTNIRFVCKCGLEGNKRFIAIADQAGAYCKKDSLLIAKEKERKTNMEKYGVESPFKSDIIKNKIKQVNIQRYGSEYPLQNKDIYNKVKETNLQRYGVENPTMNKEIYQRVKETTMKHYGVECSLKSNIIIEKGKQTNLQKYGDEFACKTNIVKLRSIATCKEKYGVEYYMQNLEVQEKFQAKCKKFKDYTMPSGTIRKVQGYEPFALDILLKEYTEEQILTDRKEVGRIPYKHGEKQRYYFPDIKIPHMNKIIEVKSPWTITLERDTIDLKANAAKEHGYDYEIWVITKKGVCQEIIK